MCAEVPTSVVVVWRLRERPRVLSIAPLHLQACLHALLCIVRSSVANAHDIVRIKRQRPPRRNSQDQP